ncbi:MAG: hypothetical protein ACYCZB_10675 [Acidiphilium sp.]
MGVLALAGCAPADPPPTPTALCQAFGYTPGAADYDRCVARRKKDQAQRARQNQVMRRLFSGAE